jgi:amino acid permease
MKLLDSIILFAGLGFIIMWVNEFIYKHASFKDSYFFLMFSLALFMTYIYRRGQRKIEDTKQMGIKKDLGKKKIEERIKKKI